MLWDPAAGKLPKQLSNVLQDFPQRSYISHKAPTFLVNRALDIYISSIQIMLVILFFFCILFCFFFCFNIFIGIYEYNKNTDTHTQKDNRTPSTTKERNREKNTSV